jgi:hypothetical protein
VELNVEAQRQPKIVFLVMSAVNAAATVDQLARALAPHLVLVHHDFSQTPVFRLTASNVLFVPEPRRTGWNFFGFVDGIFHSLRYALTHLDFDYLQLLSPSCLPIKPRQQFEAHVSGPAEAHFCSIDLLRDRDAMMSVGYRAFTPEKSLRFRIFRRLSQTYFGQSGGRRDEAGVWLRTGGGRSVAARAGLLAVTMLSWRWLGRHIFDAGFPPYYGSAWFGARRHVVTGMLELFERPGLRDYFSRLCLAEEFLIPTLLMHLRPVQAPMNHHIQMFDGAHAGAIAEAHIDQLRNCPAYFARKFPDDAAAPVRLRVLDELAGAQACVSGPVQALTQVPTAARDRAAAPEVTPVPQHH